MKKNGKVISVAPMMDWTDRHCRFLHRQFSRSVLLYTEMVVADAAIHGPRERLLGHVPAEHPVALQLGGSDPAKLAEASKIGADFGYDEINLNVGCPSDRVKSGAFGACLMLTPDLVGACVTAMKEAVSLPVTVKCRIGVDDQDVESGLDRFADTVFAAGADALWVHARKAWLQGLSPAQNRSVPPLDHERVYRLKQRLPDRFIGINGGIETPEEVAGHLEHTDGVMLGRAAYRNPAMLAEVEARLHGRQAEIDWDAVIEAMAQYSARHIARGGRLSHVTRHMVGLFHGHPGARRFRQVLSTEATRPGAGPEVLRAAYRAVDLEGGRRAA